MIKKHTAKELDVRCMRDEYAERVRQLVDKKRKQGKDVVEAERDAEEREATPEVDLLETIRRSLQHGNGARSNGRRRKRSDSDWQDKSKDELYKRAKKLDIPDRSKLNKQELIREISRAKS